TDGTAAGTRLVRDLCPGICNSFPADPFPLGNVLLFTANGNPGHDNRQVWKTDGTARSEEHTSELQSRSDLVCRLLLEKKNINPIPLKIVPNHTFSFRVNICTLYNIIIFLIAHARGTILHY